MRDSIDLDSICFVIPAYNEERNIRGVVEAIRSAYSDVRIVVVDDGSADATAKTALEAGATALRLPFNLGIGAAVQTGILFALERDAQWIIRLDGDGQHDPADIRQFLDRISDAPADLLIGSRFIGAGGFRSSLVRRMAINFLNRFISLLTGFRITDATSGFRAYSRQAMEKLCRFYPDDYPEPESIIMLYKWGMSVAEVPVTMKKRPEGTSSITAIRSVYYMVKVTMAILLDLVRY